MSVQHVNMVRARQAVTSSSALSLDRRRLQQYLKRAGLRASGTTDALRKRLHAHLVELEAEEKEDEDEENEEKEDVETEEKRPTRRESTRAPLGSARSRSVGRTSSSSSSSSSTTQALVAAGSTSSASSSSPGNGVTASSASNSTLRRITVLYDDKPSSNWFARLSLSLGGPGGFRRSEVVIFDGASASRVAEVEMAVYVPLSP